MCCLFTVLMFLGPRAALGLWWLIDMNWFARIYDTFIWPFLGFLFLPFTTLMWTLVLWWHPNLPVSGWDWLWIGLAVLVDIGSYTGGGYFNRNRIPGYSSSGA